jgi:uncharacterized delta-60 repeat protein
MACIAGALTRSDVGFGAIREEIMKRIWLTALFLLAVVLRVSGQSGALDSSFQASLDGSVFSIAFQSDGKILIGGTFTEVNGQPQQYLARLRSDGSLDRAFSAPLVLNGSVTALAVQHDGKILIGGFFDGLNGGAPGIGRLRRHGSVDKRFVGAVPAFWGIALGKNDLFGVVSDYGPWILERNGNAVASNTNKISFGSDVPYVYTIASHQDGFLFGGRFDYVGGQFRPRMCRLEADGSLDLDFAPLSRGTYREVDIIVAQPDGKFYAGGYLVLSRFNADGSYDETFSTVEVDFEPNAIRAIAIQGDGKPIIGGDFMTVNDTNKAFIARLNTDGSLDTNFATTLNNSVEALAIQPDGKILVGGTFAEVNGTARIGIVRLLDDRSPKNRDAHATR